MGKVGKKQFADGWQRQGKRVSQKLSETRRGSTQKEARQASSIMEKVRTNTARKTAQARTANEARAKSHVESGKSRPQNFEKARPETQNRAARQSETASKEFLKNRQEAGNLKKLQTKAVVSSKMSTQPATKKAVVQKGTTNQLDLGRQRVEQPVAKLLKGAEQTARNQIAREKIAHHISKAGKQPQKGKNGKAKPGAPKPADTNVSKDAARASSQAKTVVPQMAGTTEGRGTRDEGRETKKGKNGRRATSDGPRTKGAARASGSDSTKDLNAMLGGFSGGSDTGNMEAENGPAVAAVEDVEREGALPESDPSLHIYSEFDSENPGIEAVKSKAQLFSRFVEKKKRLNEIAKLDSELDGKIDDLFKNKPFTERIVGDLKDEIKLASMLGSVYGGGFRG